MVITLTIPELGKEKRIKDMVIGILSFEWPLTLTAIYNRISKNYNHFSTCQATFKAMYELVEEGVLLKKNKEYSINPLWIEKIKEFSTQIEKNYKGKGRVPLMEGLLKVKKENNVTILTFDSIIEMDKAWLNIKKDYYKGLAKKNEVTFWEGNHCWWLLVYPELEYSEMELIKKKKIKHFTIVHNNTSLDIVAKNFYERAGVKFKIEKISVDSDMTIFGDTIMQVYLPQEIKKKIDFIYEKYKTPAEVDVHDFLKNILTKKIQVNLVLTKNKDIAEQLKQKILKEFN